MFSAKAAGLVKHQTVCTDDSKEKLFDAVTGGNALAVEEILKKDKLDLVNTPFPKGNLPLNVACVNGDDQLVKILLAKVIFTIHKRPQK
jgi:ankyrin repeat protein